MVGVKQHGSLLDKSQTNQTCKNVASTKKKLFVYRCIINCVTLTFIYYHYYTMPLLWYKKIWKIDSVFFYQNYVKHCRILSMSLNFLLTKPDM